MKQSVGAKPILLPNPVLIIGTYDDNGVPNIMNVAWGGVCCSEPPCVGVSLRKATYSYQNIINRGAFTVNIPSEKFVTEADYAGIVSGREINKFEQLNLTPVKSTLVDAPYIQQFPMILECKLLHTIDIGLHTQFIGEILDIKADSSVLNDKGLPDIEKVKPFIFGSFGSRNYYSIGENIGKAFSVGNCWKK
ncbi:flavin reductase family protein [bacterium]|nr:flavin reductase family protein [bacterium]